MLYYPHNRLRIVDGSVLLPVTYKKVWEDGFGARGWKVITTIGNPEIIASTREAGQRINTSVFIYDILDHVLSGFGVSHPARFPLPAVAGGSRVKAMKQLFLSGAMAALRLN